MLLGDSVTAESSPAYDWSMPDLKDEHHAKLECKGHPRVCNLERRSLPIWIMGHAVWLRCNSLRCENTLRSRRALSASNVLPIQRFGLYLPCDRLSFRLSAMATEARWAAFVQSVVWFRTALFFRQRFSTVGFP